MSASHKICPSCHTPAELASAACHHCGRQFRTVFAAPADQTILGSGPTPVVRPPHVPHYTPTEALGGPLDNTERNVSMVWTGAGLFLAAAAFIGITRILTEALLERSGAVQISASLFHLTLFGWLLSFLVMRLRRLYLSAPGGAIPGEILRRRNRFAVAVTVLLPLMLLFGVGVAAATVYERRVEERQAAEAAQEREWQAAEEAALRERQLRDAELRMEANRQRVQLEVWKERARIEAEARSAAARAPGGSPAGRFGDGPGPASSRPPVRPFLPCGHPEARRSTAGFGNVTWGECSQGHQFRQQNGSWISER